ncbi:MAG: hypothetical protein WC076_09765 [Terrimicrobiaceae bacterium]|nr:hypothetical protein [Terrimicrobiaceae bacterium]
MKAFARGFELQRESDPVLELRLGFIALGINENISAHGATGEVHRFAARLPQRPGRNRGIKANHQAGSSMEAAKGFGIAFEVDAATRKKYIQSGIDLEAASAQLVEDVRRPQKIIAFLKRHRQVLP